MHPTADTAALIILRGAARQVMPAFGCFAYRMSKEKARMNWYEIKLPEDALGYGSPEALIACAKRIYKEVGFPTGFGVFQAFDQTHKRTFYFNPVATERCADLLKSYRGRERQEPIDSDRPIILVAGDQSLHGYFSD